MAQRNLNAAADAAELHADRARELGVSAREIASWRAAARSMLVPYDEQLGVHPQSEGFTRHPMWDFKRTSADQYPLMLRFPDFDLYRKQVVKQATWCWRCSYGQTHSPASRKPGISRTTSASRYGTPHCLRAARPAGGRDRAPPPGLRLPGRGGDDGPGRPAAQHARRPAYGLAGRIMDCRGTGLRRHALAPWRAGIRAAAAPALTRLAFTIVSGGRGCASRPPARPTYTLAATGLRWRSVTMASVSCCPLAVWRKRARSPCCPRVRS